MNRTTKHTSLKRQRGVSLPVALILLVPLTLLAVTLANRNNLEELMAGSQRDGQQSLMNAESGLAMGQQVLDQAVVNQFNAQMVNPDLTLTVNDVVTVTDASTYTVISYGGTAMSNYGLTRGTVTVVVVDNEDGDDTQDTDGQVILRSTGNFQSGERVVEAIVELNFTPPPSSSSSPPLTIFTEDWLDLNGNPDFFGPDSLIHSNSYVNIGGTTRVAGEIQSVEDSSGTYSQAVDGVWGDWTNTEVTEGVSRLQTPYVYPPVYKGMATHYMTYDCEIWNGVPGETSLVTGVASVMLEGNAKDNPWNGWKCSGDSSGNDKWELLGDVSISGFYYVEGNLVLNGNTGLEGDPLEISIVAEGTMDVSGNPYITPYYPQGDFTTEPSRDALAQIALDILSGDAYSYNDVSPLDAVLLSDEVLLLAGGDLNIQGNPGSSYSFSGIVATHDHFTISGNPRMSGAVIAENAKYSSQDFFFDNIMDGKGNVDFLTLNQISGEPDIYGSSNLGGAGNASTGDPIGANLKGWREVIE